MGGIRFVFLPGSGYFVHDDGNTSDAKGAVRDRCYQAVLDRMRENRDEYNPNMLKGRRDIRVLPLRRVVLDVIRDSVTVNAENEEGIEPVKRTWKQVKVVQQQQQPVIQGATPAMKATTEGGDEVTVEDQQWVILNGKKVTYTATMCKCEKCASQDESEHHRPVCFLGQCNHCGRWGHKAKLCKMEKK